MPKVAAKRKQGNGESEEETNSCRVCFPRSTVVAKLPVVPLVGRPEAASHAHVSTPSSIETSTPKLSSPPRSTVVAKLPVVPLVVMPEG